MRLRITDQQGTSYDQSVKGPVARLGRDANCEISFDRSVFPMVSGLHAQIERKPTGLLLSSRSQRNPTLLNDEPIEASASLKVGDRIRLGQTGPTIQVLSVDTQIAKLAPSGNPSRKARPATPEKFGETIQADSQHLNLLRGSMAAERFEIGAGGILGREKGKVKFHLDHPHISRRHARIKVEDDSVRLTDLGSANGTYVNGRRVIKSVLLDYGDRIDVGPFSLKYDGEALVSLSRSNNVELVARKLRRVVRDRATGEPLILLQDISLVIRPREFVCLLGPSGSGKSTLLAMLSGRNPPNRGAVEINGQDLYENFGTLKQDIAVVPQKDVLHVSLPVRKGLQYTAALRLPPDTGRDEIEASVSDILEVVGLSKRSETLVRHLSGGQVKRASLANELMAKPSLLFLDEVTSGLDEQTDREMMELFRQVADSGKTVVCITHSLANVEASCHLVVILTEGGWLAFIGTPEEAKKYFGITRLGDVYGKLAERVPAEWQAAYKASPFYGHYVRERLAGDLEEEEKDRPEGQAEARTSTNVLRQAWILTHRYVAIWRGDPLAIMAILGQSLLVALLLGVVFGRLSEIDNPVERAQRTVNLLFLLNVACFWFGCNNAAKELVKERVIYSRERDFNLRLDSYYLSKFLVLALIAVIQVGLLYAVVRSWTGLPGSVAWQVVTLTELAVVGTALGLLISAFARTEEVAVALVPIAIMPQIILAGVIAPLTGVGKWLADGLITVRWAERSLEALLPTADLNALGLEKADVTRQLLTIGAHGVVFAIGTLLLLWRQGKAKGTA